MLSTAETIKRKLAEVIASGIKQAAIAQHCEVSKQAVQSWKNTGRIDKRHLPALAEVTGKPLEWWLDMTPEALPEQTDSLPALVARERAPAYIGLDPSWPFQTVQRRDYEKLDTHQRSLVEGYIHGLLAEATRNKRDGNPQAA